MHVLVDGKNLLYRTVFAARGKREDRFVTVCKQLYYYYMEVPATEIHVFWDSARTDLWRTQLYSDYKEGRREIPDDIRDDLARCQSLCQEAWRYMGVKQYLRDAMEADDLIYAFCHFYNGDDIVIFSSDKDLYQIPYYFDSIQLYDTGDKRIIERPNINPIRIKCLQGDVSDNIDGYHGVGKIKSPQIAESNNAISEFLEKRGDDRFMRNLQLIDLALCPHLMDNIRYVIECSRIPPEFNKEKLKSILYSKHNIRGIDPIYKRILLQFSKLDRSDNGR